MFHVRATNHSITCTYIYMQVCSNSLFQLSKMLLKHIFFWIPLKMCVVYTVHVQHSWASSYVILYIGVIVIPLAQRKFISASSLQPLPELKFSPLAG
jgi:hypothetical protein